MERGITVGAKFASGGAGTQPVAASQTFRINTLHGPTRQILQGLLPLERRTLFPTLDPWTRNAVEKLQGFCGQSLVVSRGKIQSLVVELRMAQWQSEPLGEPRLRRQPSARRESSPREKTARPLQVGRVCTQSVLRRVEQQSNCVEERRPSDADWDGTDTVRRGSPHTRCDFRRGAATSRPRNPGHGPIRNSASDFRCCSAGNSSADDPPLLGSHE